MRMLRRIIIQSVGLMLIAQLVPGFEITSWGIAVIASIVLAILNAFVRPVLFILTLPINILTLGIFSFFINACILSFTSGVIGNGFEFTSYWSAVIVSILLVIYQRVVDRLLEGR